MQGKKLHIAVLVKRFVLSGGAERYAVEVTRKLAQRGHRVDLYARQTDPALLDGIDFIRLSDPMGFSSVLSSVSFARKTAGRLAGASYDVVHSHERGYFQDVLTVHTFSYRGGMAGYPWWKRIDRLYLSPRSHLYLWLERRQMRTSWLAAVSGAIQEDISRFYGRSDQVAVISPGVDIERFHPEPISRMRQRARQEEGISGDSLVILFVGSEFRRKGLDLLIPAIGEGMRLLVVGKGERMEHYRDLARRAGKAERIFFKGHADDVFRYYAAADAVVLPSLSEAFGMCILEAMACGLPVVVSSQAGVSPLVEDGADGFVLRSFPELSRILEILRDPERRRQMGLRARQKAEGHTWTRTADLYESLFYRIAGEKQKSEVRGQKSEVRGQRSEVRGQKAEVRGQNLETDNSKLDPLIFQPET